MINVIKHISRDLPVVPGCAGLCRVVPGCAGCAGCAGCGEAYAHTYALRMVLVATYAHKTHKKRMRLFT